MAEDWCDKAMCPMIPQYPVTVIGRVQAASLSHLHQYSDHLSRMPPLIALHCCNSVREPSKPDINECQSPISFSKPLLRLSLSKQLAKDALSHYFC